MHDLKWIEANFEQAEKLLQKKGDTSSLSRLIDSFKKRRDLIVRTDELKQKRNAINAKLKGASKEEIEKCRDEMRNLSTLIKAGDKDLLAIEEEVKTLALMLPNFPLESVPEGQSEDDNPVLKTVLEKPKFNFTPKDHVEIGQLTGILDTKRAAKVSGARFAFLRGIGSQLNRALVQYFANFHVEQGDIELSPPYMVRESAMIGTGQFPKFMDDAFCIRSENDQPYYLIPTAEVPVTNYLADEIIDESELPLRFCAYSACFRAEAGAAGKDTKGIIRQHQFEKVEMVRFAKPKDCMKELDLMVERASTLLSKLELPHRIIELCGGDLGFSAEKTFDVEVYLPGQDAYREISSCSSFGTFQARRAKIRMRSENEKPSVLATLNGSGLPLGRTMVAILENHQQEDGTVKIPEVLWPYMGGKKIIPLQK